jgi:D-galactarolactone cycloisomerase
MKIREVKSYVLTHPLPESDVFGSAKGWYAARHALVVEVLTDDGLSGFGEAYGPPAVSRTIVDEVYGPRLVGRDPLAHNVIWEDLYATYRDYGRKGWAVAAISALDIALWDIKGKALRQPVASLLGGAFRARVRAYATGLYRRKIGDNAGALAREAAAYVAEGFRAVKMKVGFGLEEDVRNVRAVRQAIGPDRLLAMDANHGYDAGTAIRFARKVEDQDVAWFEEPVVPEDLDGYCQIKAAVRIPIAGGEAEFSRWGFRDLIGRRAVDIVQPDLGGCGGFSEVLRIAGMASAAGLTVYPHVWGTAVALFASLQFAAALPPNPPAMVVPSEPLFELDRTPNPLREHLAQNPPKRAGDVIEIPDGPGLGLEIDRKALEHYRA